MSRIKIISDGTVCGTKVFSDGEDISSSIASITWTMDAKNQGPHVTITTIPVVEVDVEAEVNG